MDSNNYIDINFDYKGRDILLSKQDFMQNLELEINPHIIKGSYISYKNYLNTLFYLEYEDCYRALKKEMYKIQSNQKSINLMNEEEIEVLNKNSNLFFYLDGIIRYIYFGRNGVIIKMNFCPSYQSKLNSKMMKFGSLIILSNNNFEDYIFTTVSSNEIKLVNEQKNIYRVYLSLLDINQKNVLFLLKNRNNLQVFESKAYFESYIHVMRRLQEMDEYKLPFTKELILGKFEPKIYEPININLSLDSSQLDAINKSLSNKISLIQGPPGTGKTYVGIVLVRALLQIEPNAQILIVSYTNHALDSFLEEIIKYTQSIVRIGGRCNNEIVKNYQLDRTEKYYDKNYKKYLKDLDADGENIENFINDTINSDNLLNVQEVKNCFKILYDKVVFDFFNLANIRENFYINYNQIYILWNLLDEIDDEEFQNKLSSLLLDERNTNQKEQKSIYAQLYKNSNRYNEDNVPLLNALYGNYKKFSNNINFNNFNEHINDINYEEEEYNDTFFYVDNFSESSEEESEGSEDDDIDEIIYKRLPPINEDQFDFLMDCHVNAFKFGPKIIRLIKDFMKYWLFEKDDNFNNFDFEKFNAALNRNSEYSLLSNYQIVGMTTTGCAKFSKILERSNFETIIVEEAAEVLESRIVTLLTKNTKRLILIGDHKQLRPKPYNYELETKYNFNISMFERLINNNIEYSPLIYQRRMKSVFADFVRIIYGDNLYKDHPTVNNKEKVKGMKDDMFIITHNRAENDVEDIKSKYNIYEAKYLVKLCEYLLKQGYKNNQITILTFYLEQVKRIRGFLKDMNIINIRVSSIDNYQGEECDIILLSLVRSNKKNKIGFLNNFNRVCVAFSRAKIGLYIIGNIECIINGEKENKNIIDPKMKDVWQKIYAKAKSLNIIGDKLTLCCQTHGNEMIISELKDFNNLSKEGGCKEKCNRKMKCNHFCQKICHHNYDCNEIKCEEIVDKTLPCGHIKKGCKCYINPNSINCEEIVDKTLPCGHIKKGCQCNINPNSIICEEIVDKTLPCGHIKKGCKCYINPNSINCEEIVDKILPCGHIKKGCKCKINPSLIQCEEIVDKTLSCGHIKKGCKCFIKPSLIKCEEKCERKLICGHSCKLKCYEDCNSQKCKEKCNKKMNCGHSCQNICHIKYDCNKIKCHQPCKRIKLYCSLNKHICHKLCYEKCDICEEIVDKELPCGHTKKECKCCINPNTIKCEEKCKRKLKCGHLCQLKCYENCKSQVCKQKIEFNICSHIKEIECFTNNLPDIFKNICEQKCNIRKKCNHPCNGSCNECLEGTLHIKCEEKCGKVLLCGHTCKQKCFEECICEENSHMICSHLNEIFECGDEIICDKKCNIECKHEKCNKKCGELCDRKPCEKRCDKKMICGHQCFGLCGERCPDLCKICNPNDKNFLYIHENSLLYKTKCGHIFSVNELDKYFYNTERNIEIYRCPECGNILLTEPRYQNQIKTLFIDIHNIKEIIIDKYSCNSTNVIIELIKEIISRISEQYNKGTIRIFELLPENNNINNNLFSYNKFNF